MSWGPPESQFGQPGQPPGGYGAPQGGQPVGGYGPPPPSGYEQPGGFSTPQPGQYAPPQPGQYGAPQAQFGAPKPGFDLTTVSPFDWAAMAAGVLALIFSFFSFYTATVTAKVGGQSYSQSAHENAWHGFFGWFGVILALAAALLVALAVFMPTLRVPFPTRLGVLIGFGLGLIFLIIAAFVTPGAKSGSQIPAGYSLDYGRGFGFWVDLILVIAGVVVAYLAFQQTGGTLPGLGGTSTGPGGPSAAGYGAPSYGGAPQQGYQPPPAQSYQPTQAFPAQPPAPPSPPPPYQPGYPQPGGTGYPPPAPAAAPPPPAPQGPPPYQPPPPPEPTVAPEASQHPMPGLQPDQGEPPPT